VAGQRRWLRTVARRLVIDMVRTQRCRTAEVPFDMGRVPAERDSSEGAIAAQSMLSAFGKLSDAHRGLLGDLYLRGETPQVVASRLKVPVGTVKSRAHYAMRALRSGMDDAA
jgi:RNA polymerase sigma-70 factor (ECF subfamily)